MELLEFRSGAMPNRPLVTSLNKERKERTLRRIWFNNTSQLPSNNSNHQATKSNGLGKLPVRHLCLAFETSTTEVSTSVRG